ncbi:MAG: glycosyltransferase family 4 protein [Acidobacteriota bacterium]
MPPVLHVNTAADFRGGERQTLFLAVGQWRAGADVRVATPPRSELARRLRDDGFPSDRIDEIRMRGDVSPAASFALARAARAHGTAVLHLHTAHAHALGVAAARLCRVKTIVHRRVDYPMAPGYFSRLKYRLADAFVAISEAVRSILILDGIERARVFRVLSGIRIPGDEVLAAAIARRDALRDALGIARDARVILNVGNLVDHKGQAILPEAARILPSRMRILIAGDGPLRGDLEARIAKEGVADRVTLLGHRNDLPDLYALADAYAQPSTSEGLGTAMLDAMAWRLPVVATAAGGIPEAVRDGENGLLLPGRNPYLLGEAIKRVLGDEGLARRLGERGRAIAAAEFSDGRMVAEMAEVYERVIAGGAAPLE